MWLVKTHQYTVRVKLKSQSNEERVSTYSNIHASRGCNYKHREMSVIINCDFYVWPANQSTIMVLAVCWKRLDRLHLSSIKNISFYLTENTVPKFSPTHTNTFVLLFFALFINSPICMRRLKWNSFLKCYKMNYQIQMLRYGEIQ